MATDAEVEAQRARVVELQKALTEGKLAQQDVIREAQNDAVMASLKAEEDRLVRDLKELATTVVSDVPTVSGTGAPPKVVPAIVATSTITPPAPAETPPPEQVETGSGDTGSEGK